MRVEVETDLCEANGLCVLEAPEVFAIGDDDDLQITRPDVLPADVDAVVRAARACPKQALRITDGMP